MIKIENVSKHYLVDRKTKKYFTSLLNVNLTIDDNTILGIIGNSGAGKSTLLRMLNGLVLPSEGRIIVDGLDINTLKPQHLNQLRQTMGMVFQSFNLLLSLTVYQNVKLALDIIKYPKEQKHQRIIEVLTLVGLADKQSLYPASLSGGQKQRLAIARAIANHPKYLLCDEITSALDHNTALEIIEVLKDIKNKLQMSIIFITHQLNIARKLCTNLVLIEDGQIVELNTTKEFFTNPKTTRAKELIGNILELPTITDAYRLVYDNSVVTSSLLSKIIKEYQIDVNIIDAKTIDILDEQIGYLTIKISGSNTDAAIKQLNQERVGVISC